MLQSEQSPAFREYGAYLNYNLEIEIAGNIDIDVKVFRVDRICPLKLLDVSMGRKSTGRDMAKKIPCMAPYRFGDIVLIGFPHTSIDVC